MCADPVLIHVPRIVRLHRQDHGIVLTQILAACYDVSGAAVYDMPHVLDFP